ncbi:MAG TPA: glutathione S-transferase family protein [Rhizomicrobium sp.]|jgi:glutathione S-transferase
MLTLYFAPGASSMAPHIALHETGAAFEARPVSFATKEQREPAYLALNPLGQVPTLVIDGRPLTEVAGCLFYIARAFPAAGLLPGDSEGDARVVSWMSYIASTIHPARRRGIEAVAPAYDVAESRMDDGWLVGGYSVADIHLFRLFWRASNSLALERARYPRLYAHHDRMMERPAVRKTIDVESAIGYHLPA